MWLQQQTTSCSHARATPPSQWLDAMSSPRRTLFLCNRLLAIALWLFFASGLLMLKPPGHGVVYLGPGPTRVRFTLAFKVASLPRAQRPAVHDF